MPLKGRFFVVLRWFYDSGPCRFREPVPYSIRRKSIWEWLRTTSWTPPV